MPPARRENTNASSVDEAALPDASFISDHARSSDKLSSSRRRARRISAFSRWRPAVSSRQNSPSRGGRNRNPKGLDRLSACIRVLLAVMTSCRQQQACAAGMPAASRSTRPLRKSIAGGHSGALLPTATRPPTCISHAVRIFGKVAHRHEKPSLQAFWRSSGNRPPSVPRPGDRASKVRRDFGVYTSCCFHHICKRNCSNAMAVLQLDGVFCSPPFKRAQGAC